MPDHKTSIENLPEKIQKKTTVNIDTDRNTLSEIILDLSEELETRIESLKIFCDKFGQDQLIEFINKLSNMYQFSGIKLLEQYLYEICVNTNISSLLKIMIAKNMCYFENKKEIGYEVLEYVCRNMTDASTTNKVEAIFLLMTNKKYKEQSNEYFCRIINDHNLDCEYRYKTILSLDKNNPEYIYFLTNSTLYFFNEIKNKTLYRILSAQVLLQKCKLTTSEINNIETTLLSFSQDPDIDYNLRADSADVILQLGSDDNKQTAREIIMMLGQKEGRVRTIFDNTQNVHNNEIENSLLIGLEFLSNISINTISGVPGTPEINFEFVKKEITNLLENEKPKEDSNIIKEKYNQKVDKINISLNRIYLDRVLYSKYNYTLLYILLKIWSYLSSHKSQKEMEQRLLEELVDMSGTCSSGFASRLINVISGFGDFNMKISWNDQIIANFIGRFNARIKNITNDEKRTENAKLYEIEEKKDEKNNIISIEDQLEIFQEKVLEEMAISNCNFVSKQNFFKFFMKNLVDVREELAKEFKSHISDNDFDIYFRNAISTYEIGEY